MKILNFFGVVLLLIETNAFDIENYVETILKIKNDSTLSFDLGRTREWKKLKDLQTCGPIINEPATSVHKLRPSDIKIVAALGDSLTAALGAKANTVFGMLSEDRGISWSIGGDDDYITLPNIMKQFNPYLIGFSKGSYLPIVTREGVGLNVAVSGHEANDIPNQARILIERIKNSKNLNINDWKLITLFIGGNDICDFCKDLNLHSPESYIKYIEQALELIQKELPKTFVNLVMVFNVTQVRLLNLKLTCTVIHRVVCPCAAFKTSDDPYLPNIILEYQDFIEKLVDSGKYETKDDFTVVVQPFMKDLILPKIPDGIEPDLSYFAPDCFHFSAKSHGKIKFTKHATLNLSSFFIYKQLAQ